jgi:hypothetical protein
MTMPRGHTGTTSHGNTRDVRVERLGHVTIYKRGKSSTFTTANQARASGAEWTAPSILWPPGIRR